MKLLYILFAVGLTFALAAHAEAVAVKKLVITEFGFALDHPTEAQGGSDDSLNEQINMEIIMGTYQGGAGWDPLTTPDGTDADKNAGILGFDFLFYGPVAAYTSADDLFSDIAPMLGVFPPPTGDATGSVLRLDLSAWSFAWSGYQVPQGPDPGTLSTTYDPGTGAFTADWSRFVPGGPGFGNHWYWSLAGTAVLVPEPVSMVLVGTAVAGLIAIRRPGVHQRRHV